MKKIEFNQGVTIKVYPQAHLRADGMNAIYLRVTIERKKKEINLKVYWPIAYFDQIKQVAKTRHTRDTEVETVNMVINEAKGRANRIKLRYFTNGKLLSLDLFVKEFENFESRDNFIHYWETKKTENLRNGRISEGTYNRHGTNLGRFKQFTGSSNFFSMEGITTEFVQKYQTWLKKRLAFNTVTNALKCFQTYVNSAREDGFKIEDPFGKIKLRYLPGERAVLERHELKALQTLMEDEKLPDIMREVLRRFLFSCFTGLRISDTSHITRAMITRNILRVKIVKGRRQGKEVQIPLPNYAAQLIEGRKGLLFQPLSDPKVNQWLKLIAKDANIDKQLTFHVSRDTFATLFIEMGGDVFTLKELMGHSDIKTTMIYVKMSENRKGVLMDNFNNL